MISLVLAMVWTRRGQAVTLALLALFAVASAVASPAYLAATGRAVAAGQIATALPAERGLVVSAVQNDRADESTGDPSVDIDFTNVGPALIDLPGFTYVFSAEFPAMGIEPGVQRASRLVFRQDTCEHVRIVSGRCLIGEGEVIIGAATADRLKLVAGDRITLGAAKFNQDPRTPGYLPDGVPKQLVVAGVYQVVDPGETYWGTHGYFTALPGRGPGEPVFTDSATRRAMDHGNTEMAIDGTAGPQALNVDHLDELRAGLENLQQSRAKLGTAIQINTGMPELLDRIDAGRAAARLLVPVLAVPLVLLACFSIFLAVSYGTDGRQPELAVVALRGARWWMRWWLATGESLAAVVAGAIAGCVTGQLLVNAVAAARFPGVGTDPDWSSLRYAPLAALAALLAAVLAQRRQLLSPVATLLRRNPAVANGPRALAVEALIVLLALVTGLQLVVSGGTLTGVGTLAPAFVILALALLAARALLPAVTRYAGWALRRGRLGVALAGFQLSRRPGAQRLFALLVATVAVAGYAGSAVDVATRGRAVQAGLGVGADRVLTVQPATRSQLLHATHAVDPDGRFAMAVTRLPNSGADEPLGLAVDSPRLAAVAIWPDGAPPAATVATGLRPAAAEPIILAGQDLSLRATSTGIVAGRELKLNLAVSSMTGLGDTVVQLGELHEGPYDYGQRVGICRDGCRLNGIQLAVGSTVVGVTGRIVLTGLGTTNPTRVAASAAQLADPSRWRLPDSGRLSAAPGGLQIDVDAPSGLPGGAWIHPVDAPYPLPVADAGRTATAGVLTGLDGNTLPVTVIATLPAVPRIGVHATLVDLEYADRLAVDGATALLPQVWLNPRAPADILDRLAAEGLTVLDDTRSAQVRRQLDEQGPALALWFYVLAGTLSVLLGAGALVLAAAVDRSRRVEDLSALRTQGLSRPMAGRATLWTYPVLVAIAAVVGALTALIAWGVTGWALPLAGLDPPDLPLPAWPRVLALLGTTVAVFLVLALVATATGRDLHRRIDRRDPS
ncbi:FtsX-like permease family protein [Micromonosporaceae bacterium Da 78-11]